MALFDLVDFGKRLVSVLPQSWFPATDLIAGSTPIAPNAIPIADIMQGFGSGYATVYAEIPYVLLQTRLQTATDKNLDQASLDLFAGVLPRVPNEPDSSFRARIMQLVIAPQPTIPGLQAVLSAYFAAVMTYNKVSTSFAADTQGAMDTGQGGFDVTLAGNPTPTRPLAADTQGSLDNWGFADQPGPLTAPAVYVFDQQSDPVTAAILGITPPHFCVAIVYPGVALNLLAIVATPFTQVLVNLTRWMMAEGVIDTYAANGP